MVDACSASLKYFEKLNNEYNGIGENPSNVQMDRLREIRDECHAFSSNWKSLIDERSTPRAVKESLESVADRFASLKVRLEWRFGEAAEHRSQDFSVSLTHSLFGNRFATFLITNFTFIDPAKFLDGVKDSVKKLVQKQINIHKSVKVGVIFCCEFFHPHVGLDLKYFNPKYEQLFLTTNLTEWFSNKVKCQILTSLQEFECHRSGWALSEIVSLKIKIVKLQLIHGGCVGARPLNKFIRDKHGVINIRENDNYCFADAVWVGLQQEMPALNRNLRNSYPDWRGDLHFGDLEFPIALKDISKFENMNMISVNVFMEERKEIFSVHLTEAERIGRHVNLFIDHNAQGNHYCCIRNLSRFLCSQIGRHNGARYFCNRCLHHFPSDEKLNDHKIDCGILNDCKITLPEHGKNILKFTNFSKK